MTRSRKYTDEELVSLLPSVDNLASLIKALGYDKLTGGAYTAVKSTIHKNNLDISHFKDASLEALVLEPKTRLHSCVRNKLVADRKNTCELCSLCEWRGFPAVMEVHHIDGDHANNLPTNLQVLCLQCHAQTDNWRGKGRKLPEGELKKRRQAYIKEIVKIKECSCGIKINRNSLKCAECSRLSQIKLVVSKEELEKLIEEMPMTKIGEMFGVAGNTVKKRANELGIFWTNKQGYWAKKKAKQKVMDH